MTLHVLILVNAARRSQRRCIVTGIQSRRLIWRRHRLLRGSLRQDLAGRAACVCYRDLTTFDRLINFCPRGRGRYCYAN